MCCKVKKLNRRECMDINKNIKICSLLDVYGELLSDKQQKVLRLYYFEDMSLSEIADIEGISRPAVLDSIHSGEAKLELYESKIRMLELRNKLNNCISNKDIKSELEKILEEF